MTSSETTTIALLTHTFPPDPAAVGQHMADLADALAERGHRVIVLTSDRGYDDPSIQFDRNSVTKAGVEIRRLARTSFGKSSLAHRGVGIISFILQAASETASIEHLGGIVFTTSPPFIGAAATLVARARNIPTVFWAMDLNPDQLVALGKIKARGLVARGFRILNRFMLRRADAVIALDSLMATRLVQQGADPEDVVICPPWSPEETLDSVDRRDNAFRRMHGLGDDIVVMYSGNHSPSNPLTTLLSAAVALRDVDVLKFVFVGNGVAKREVEQVIAEHKLRNVLSLPYQPKSQIGTSLSAGDVHVVSLGEKMAGVIHPCKVYGAMGAGRPILYFGPSPSHVTSILAECDNGWSVQHGDVNSAVAILGEIASRGHGDLDSRGARGRDLMQTKLRASVLVARVADTVVSAIASSRFVSATPP